MRSAHSVKGIIAVGAGEQTEGEQQRERAEARHQQIDVADAHVLSDPMMCDHQRPGGERHEFPRHQEAEGVVRHDHEVHGGKIGGIERQHALRGVLVAAIAEREQARRSAAEIDHHQEKCRQRVDAEMRAQPGQAERQCHGGGRVGISEQAQQRDHAQRQRDHQACAIKHAGAARRGAERDRDGGQDHQCRHAVKRVDDHHLSRTQRRRPRGAAQMMVVYALYGVAALVVLAPVAIALGASPRGTSVLYGASLMITLTLGMIALLSLFGYSDPSSTVTLPLGLPWLGAHFRIDALAAFFLVVVNLGGASASLFALGYGRHEHSPQRVLPFYPAYLAAMNLVVMADDAFSFLVSWEFMSLTSWALVISHHRIRENVRAGYIYLLMASFGTLALLLSFGLLAGSDGNYAFDAIRARSEERRV